MSLSENQEANIQVVIPNNSKQENSENPDLNILLIKPERNECTFNVANIFGNGLGRVENKSYSNEEEINNLLIFDEIERANYYDNIENKFLEKKNAHSFDKNQNDKYEI